MIYDLIIISLAIIYAILIIWLLIGWMRHPFFKPGCFYINKKISVVIPARNEEDNICECLEALYKQEYPDHNYEVIVVDDHSSDETSGKVIDFIKRNNAGNFKLLTLSPGSSKFFGKKHALNRGINESKFDFIITTDADCTMGRNWLKTVGTYCYLYKPEMLIMPVAITQGKKFFEKIQVLEFLSLAGVTGATAGWKNHMLCNGANLGFNKKSFFKVGGYNDNLKYASGDDVFLLHKIKKKFPKKIHYLKNRDVVVSTQSLKSVSDFFNQRKRWFSKSKAFKDKLTVIIGLIVGVFNIMLVFSIFYLFFTGIKLWLLGWGLKIVIDFFFLLVISFFFQKQKLLLLYFPASLLYPLYVFITFILGIKGKFSWKERYYY